MPMVRCSTKKHIFNSDVHDSCPYCTFMVDSPASLNLDGVNQGFKTEVINEANSKSSDEFTDTVKINNDVNKATQRIYSNEPTLKLDDDISENKDSYSADKKDEMVDSGNNKKTSNKPVNAMKTQVYGFQNSKTPINEASQTPNSVDQLPVTGWLVIIQGPGIGADFRLIQGENRIGRDSSMEVCLDFNQDSDEMVSRDSHAIVVYDNNANIFFVERGRSRNLPLLNDKTIRMGEDIKSGDIIQVGKTKLMLVTFCNENFKW